MALSSRHIVFSALASVAVGAVILACGSDGSTFNDGSGQTGTFSDASLGSGDGSALDPYANDPAPKYCGPDGGTAPVVTGSAECPDDKNKPGCGCAKIGDTAPCWTGFRSDRNLGDCHDGVTTCRKASELSNAWGSCEGEQLPVMGATGAAACSCFSIGKWDIKNTSPCLRSPNGTDYYAYSTTYDPASGTVAGCTGSPTDTPPQGTAPSAIWSTDKLTVDCAGTFTLCFRIRAGDFNHPNDNDCTLGETCVDNATYATAKTELELPNLPGWAGKDAACAKKWEHDTPETVSPGYGEMIVKGQTVTCDAVDDGHGNDYVFHRVQYCPKICRDAAHQQDAVCVACQTASSGEFTPAK